MSRGITLQDAQAQPGGITREQARRLPGESMADYRPWRDAYAQQQRAPFVRKEVIEREVKVHVEVPVEKVVEREVEVVKEIDRPETLERLKTAETRLAQMRGELDEARAKSVEKPDYQFQRDFLHDEKQADETLEQVDARLKHEMGALEARRPLKPADDARWQMLFSKLYRFKG